MRHLFKAAGLAFFALSGAAFAQSTPPSCYTNLGSAGTLLTGQFNMVSAFRDGRSAGTPQIVENAAGPKLTLFDDIQQGENFTIFVAENSPAGMAVIEFVGTQGRKPYQCSVDIRPFDAATDDPSQIAFGQCDLQRVSGSGGAFGRSRNLIKMDQGDVAVFTLPEPYIEGAVSPKRRLNYSVLFGANDVEFTAGEPGLATFFWLSWDDGEGQLRGLCPAIISQ